MLREDKRWEVIVTVMGTVIAGLIGYLGVGTYQLSSELSIVREKLTQAVTRLERLDQIETRVVSLESRTSTVEQRVSAMEGERSK